MVKSIIRELQNKTVRSHYTPIRGTTIQNTTTTTCWQGCRTGTLVHHWWEGKNGTATVEVRQLGSFLQCWAQSYRKIQQLHCWVFFQMSWNLLSSKNLHTNVYSSFALKCQKLEAIRMSFKDEWINTVVDLYDGIPVSNKKKYINKPQRDIVHC